MLTVWIGLFPDVSPAGVQLSSFFFFFSTTYFLILLPPSDRGGLHDRVTLSLVILSALGASGASGISTITKYNQKPI